VSSCETSRRISAIPSRTLIVFSRIDLRTLETAASKFAASACLPAADWVSMLLAMSFMFSRTLVRRSRIDVSKRCS
jgi:hypothetical protein